MATSFQRILIVRLSAIGDCLQTIPLVNAIKNVHPSAHITWVVDCAVDSLLRTQPQIDEVVRLKKSFLKRPIEFFNFVRTLRSKKFDWAFDPQGLLKSALITRLSGSQHSVGFAPPQSREYAWTLYQNCVTATRTHLVDRHLQLLEPTGIRVPPSLLEDRQVSGSPHGHAAVFRWNETEIEAAKAKRTIDLIVPSRRFFCVNVGAGWKSRRWPLERFAETCHIAWQQHAIPSMIIWGNSEEKEMADEVHRLAGGYENVESKSRATIIAPNTTLLELASLLKRSIAYIGSDTGPMHLAAVIGTPCIALFGPTAGQYCGPYGTNHRIIQKVDDSKSRDRKGSNNSAMLAITVEDVRAAIQDLLTRHPENRL